MSEPVYWHRPLESDFQVTVTECIRTGNEYEVSIKESVIRPEGGGQAGDRGILIDDTRQLVIRNTIQKNGRVYLITDQPVSTGERYRLRIDMEWRRNMMRNHSAEHLFVASLKRIRPEIELGYIWIDGEHGTVEVRGQNLSLEDVLAAEESVQSLIVQDLQTVSHIVNSEELGPEIRAREGVSEKHQRLRVVSFGDFDSSACSGTHVTHTGDIILFKIIDCKVDCDRVHVEFMTGQRAMRYTSGVFNTVLRRRHTHPVEYEQLGPVLDRAKALAVQHEDLLDFVQDLIIRDLQTETMGDASIGGVRFVHRYLPGFEPARIRQIIKRMSFSGPTFILFFIPGEKSSLTALGNALSSSVSSYVADIVQSLGGRGGGGAVYTGGFTDVKNPRDIYDELVRRLAERLSAGKC